MFGRSAMLLLPVLALIATPARATTGHRTSPDSASPRAYYQYAVNRLLHAHRVEIRASTTFQVGGSDSAVLDVLQPDRLRYTFSTGPRASVYHLVQIGRSQCTWNDQPSSRFVICRPTPRHDAKPKRWVLPLLVPQGGDLVHRRYAYSQIGSGPNGTIVLVVHATGDPFTCGLGASCPQPDSPYANVPYTGVLRVNRATSLPYQFDSFVKENTDTFRTQKVAISYQLPATIELPAGRRASCPRGSGRGSWCIRLTG